MHIETLKVFCDLAELLSFSKTAEKNILSQSAVSQQLAQLELVHKCQLINRKKRPIELTKEGRLFYQASKDIVDRYEQLKNQLNIMKTSSSDRINIAAIFSIGMHALPSYVKRFMIWHPKVNVHIEYFSSKKIYELVLAGEVDIGIVAAPKQDKRLEVYDFQNELLVLVCSTKHPLANKSRVDIHTVQLENFIAFEKDVPTRIWIDDILHHHNVVIQPIMEFDNIETIKRAVEINAGVSILPENTISQEVSNRAIKAIPFLKERFFRPTGIIVLKNRILSQAGRHFMELLRKKT